MAAAPPASSSCSSSSSSACSASSLSLRQDARSSRTCKKKGRRLWALIRRCMTRNQGRLDSTGFQPGGWVYVPRGLAAPRASAHAPHWAAARRAPTDVVTGCGYRGGDSAAFSTGGRQRGAHRMLCKLHRPTGLAQPHQGCRAARVRLDAREARSLLVAPAVEPHSSLAVGSRLGVPAKLGRGLSAGTYA